MNWFERYGIPGTYFYIALLSGLYAMYPHKMENIDMRALAAFAASFLPVGYIITIFSQWYYLRSKKDGLHYRALVKILRENVISTHVNEADLESLSCLNAATDFGDHHLDAHKFIQDWIRKRMDVIAINRSMQVASILAPCLILILGIALWRWDWQPKGWLIVLLIVIFALVYRIALLANRIVKKQIVKVISGVWQEFNFKYKSLVTAEAETKATTDSSTEAKN